MLVWGFFFLLHPKEYAYTKNPEAEPFCLCDMHLLIHNHHLHPMHCTKEELQRTDVALQFTMQKNGVHGELVGLGRLGHLTHCPVQALLHHVHHLWTHNTPMIAPLYSYYDAGWKRITTTMLTVHLWHTVKGDAYDIHPMDTSICSLRSSRAMSLCSCRYGYDSLTRSMTEWGNVMMPTCTVLSTRCPSCITNAATCQPYNDAQPHFEIMGEASGSKQYWPEALRWATKY